MDLIESSQMTHEEEMAHWWIKTRFFYLDRVLDDLLNVRKNSRNPDSMRKLSVLEIGCGTAQNLHYLRQNKKWSAQIDRLVGIDTGLPDQTHTQELHPRWLLNNDWIGRELQPQDKATGFDLLIAMDVLEHIDDDQKALREWIELVRPGGWIFIAVPAFQMLWSHHDESLQHKRRYHRPDLKLLAMQTGLETSWARYAFSYIFPLVYLIRKYKPKNPDSSETALQRYPGWINWILVLFGKLECLLGGNPWLGTSVVGLFQKPDRPSSPIQLSILIPAYNEEKRLPETLRKLKSFNQSHPFIKIVEIIIVNDGSRDRTARTIQTYQKIIPNLRAISLTQNQGKGFAVKKALSACKGTHALVADADMSTPWDDMILLIEAAKRSSAQIVIGSRGMKASQLIVRQGMIRETLGKTFNRFMRLMMGLPFKDTQCGFKLIEMSQTRPWLHLLQIKRFAWDVELLTLASLTGLKITEVPIHWEHREESHVRILKDGAKMTIDLLWLRIRFFLFKSRYLRSAQAAVAVSKQDQAA